MSQKPRRIDPLTSSTIREPAEWENAPYPQQVKGRGLRNGHER